ncbi:ABC transporter permease [Litorilinea aerophila]|uniref:FtsX-like permease family protein n=1 Tax=Litorilinea aerophila TaxID=1204385 RepID=A0A540VCJ8_9CHLR|nr:ABC transporter permease [Litorilinea aerophila]MCC9077707.1 ABC transporter permease [Litorilinea aerophila]OUC06904.1 hypothetical protein RY27_18110 [Litorilinea aerophila]GIV77010.1 MAG: multidrug ABC transporter substrate-binding protein [Litorilinea sp.]
MRVLRYFAVALESILAHKLRALLTMLGIIIGVAAVLTTVGIGAGAAASITERIESGGTNLLTVNGTTNRNAGGSTTLTMGDVEALSNRTLHPDLALVVPEYTGNATLVVGTVESQNNVVGTTADYAAVRNLTVAEGAFLSPEEVEQQQRVVVLGANVAQDLFGGADPVGQAVRINTDLFQVVGVLEATGGTGFGSNDDRVFVPIGVAQKRLFNAPRHRGEYTVSSISIQAVSADRLDEAQADIEMTLRLRHGLTADEENDFSIFNQATLLSIASDVSGTLTLLLGSIGSVSLVVGGIGIMNIMLVSVTERTREIGLRKALGAHDSDILLQFLIEALVLTSVGGVLGIGLSYGVGYLVSNMSAATFRVVILPQYLVLALVVSSACGFVFGLYPAMRATQLDPIEALRFE